MRRREFITLLGGAAAWPLAARAQQQAMPVVGFLSPGSLEADALRLSAFKRGLKEIGYLERQNVAIEYRGVRSQYDHLPAVALDLVGRQVSVIVTIGTPATLAAKAATSTVPIVFAMGADPVQFTLLTNPSSPFAEVETETLYQAARTLGVELRVLNAVKESEIDTAFATLAKEHSVPLVVSADAMFINQRVRIVVLAARHAIPAIYSYREFSAAGGLMSYGSDLADAYRQVGIYTGRILKGTKPTDLPVQQSVKVELVINLNTAIALGIPFPLPLLGRADEVIE
jgi:putative tryptophan/tyrosine transport system substrate-binding protein